jgi:hypothetical protein
VKFRCCLYLHVATRERALQRRERKRLVQQAAKPLVRGGLRADQSAARREQDFCRGRDGEQAVAKFHAVHSRHFKIRDDQFKIFRRGPERGERRVRGIEALDLRVAELRGDVAHQQQNFLVVVHDHPARRGRLSACVLVFHAANLRGATLRKREAGKIFARKARIFICHKTLFITAAWRFIQFAGASKAPIRRNERIGLILCQSYNYPMKTKLLLCLALVLSGILGLVVGYNVGHCQSLRRKQAGDLDRIRENSDAYYWYYRNVWLPNYLDEHHIQTGRTNTAYISNGSSSPQSP